MRDTVLKATELMQGFAAEASGVDLTSPLSRDDEDEIRAALESNPLLIFRDQMLTDDDQLRFASIFGRLRTSFGLPSDDLSSNKPYIGTSGNIDDDGNIISSEDERQASVIGSRAWHTDLPYRRLPDRYTVLSSRVVPSRGGNTQFADTAAAWNLLPQEQQEQLLDLIVIHDLAYLRERDGFPLSEAEKAKVPPTAQPLVLENQRTNRKSLYLSSGMAAIRGMNDDEARVLLDDLIQHATQEKLVYELEWRDAGTVAVWDNRCMIHRGMPYRDTKDKRILRRCTVVAGGAV
jgi:alpha-ketoglutarate-dependent 2,4-dichlorophenoxyacetate dioxygenase